MNSWRASVPLLCCIADRSPVRQLPDLLDTVLQITCPVCFSDVPASKTLSAGCNHFACRDCWQGYLQAYINDKSTITRLKCIGAECKVTTPFSVLFQVADEQQADILRGYEDRLAVETNALASWCCRPDCDLIAVAAHPAKAPTCATALRATLECTRQPLWPAGRACSRQQLCLMCAIGPRSSMRFAAVDEISVASCRPLDVKCKCGQTYCFACKEPEAHRPVACDTVKAWNIKNSAESENLTWIIANTKPCPQCQRPIQKNQGCMHMTCSLCRHEFCWLCQGEWSKHGEGTGGYYACNKCALIPCIRRSDLLDT